MVRIGSDHLVIASAAVLSHGPSLGAGFVWLDHAHIEGGLALARAGDFGGLFTRGFAGTGYYRPLMSVSLSLDAALGGAPALYHATTLLWHAGAALLAAIAAEQLGLSRRAAAAAALLFAVHPLTGLVANTIAFRSEAMLAVLLLALVVLHLRRRAWACGALLFAAALCKETALILGPLWLISLEIFGPGKATRAARSWSLLGAEAVGLACALGLRLSFAPAWRAGFPPLSAEQAIGTRLASVTKSALAVFFPVDIGVCDAFPITSTWSPTALAGLAALLGIAYLAYRRGGPAMLLALSLLPSLQLVPVMRWWSPHYLYVPLAFAAMLLAERFEQWGERALRWLAPLALALGGLSVLDARHYLSDERLWSHEVKLEPGCREGHYYLADAALQAKQLEVAAEHYQRALATQADLMSYVDQGAALQNLGVTRLQQGRFEEASDAFRTALEGERDATSRRQLLQNLASAEALAKRAH